jgi:hypothetical protein
LDEAIQALRQLRRRLAALGLERLRVFGSVTRDELDDDSDIDIIVDFRPGEKSFEHLLDAKDALEEALGREVDLMTSDSLSPYLRDKVQREAVDAQIA